MFGDRLRPEERDLVMAFVAEKDLWASLTYPWHQCGVYRQQVSDDVVLRCMLSMSSIRALFAA